MLQRIERDYLELGGEVYFLFDNCHSGIYKRKEIDPEYKSNRTKKEDTFYRSLDFLHLILMSYKNNYFTIKKEGMEADDLVESFVEKYKEDTILLVTNDQDWFRAISERVHVAKYMQFHKCYTIYNVEQFIEKFKFPPTNANMCLYKSIRGDKGDNIPIGIPNIREKNLVQLITEYDSIKEICLDLDNIDYLSPKFKTLIIENKARLLMNYKLVDYISISVEELEESTYQAKFSPKTLLDLYSSLNMDISKIDPRVSQYFIKKERSPKNFFKQKKIPRI